MDRFIVREPRIGAGNLLRADTIFFIAEQLKNDFYLFRISAGQSNDRRFAELGE